MRDMPSASPASPAQPAPLDPALIEKWALSYLERYAASAASLRRVLQRRARRRFGGEREGIAAADMLIDALIERYRETRLIDDAAYAASRARRDVARGRSPRRIAADLAAKGIGGAEAASALAALRDDGGDPELAAACAFARRRRLGPFRRAGAERDRELSAFARAGFSRRAAEAVLACPDEDAVAALLAGEE